MRHCASLSAETALARILATTLNSVTSTAAGRAGLFAGLVRKGKNVSAAFSKGTAAAANVSITMTAAIRAQLTVSAWMW